MDSNVARRTLLGLLGSLPLAGAAGRALAQGQAGRLRIGLSAPNTTLDPHLLSNAPNNAVASHIFDALITNDERSGSQPGLATGWRVLDDTHWSLSIRPGVRFTDGAAFTPEDAIASIQRAHDIPSSASFRTYTRSIKAMSAPDPGTLLIETHGPDPLLPNSLSRIRMIAAKHRDAAPGEFNTGRAAIGTGPFMFREYVPGSHVTLVRNDGWWGPRLPWSEVVLRVVSDPGSRLASLLAGDLDLIEEVPAEGAGRVTASPALHLLRGLSSRFVYLGMDQARDQATFITGKDGKALERNPLKDVRVRQALTLAVNRQALVERVMEGNAVAAGQFMPKGGAGTAPDLDVPRFDPERARALLADAGYPQGFRLTVHGPNNRYVNDGKIVQSVAQMFTRIGLEARVETMPWAVYVGRSKTRDFSVFLGAWGVNTGETSNPLSALLATADGPAGMGVANDSGYSNAEVDRRLKQALRTMEDGARNGLLAEACGIAFRDAALVPLHHEVSVWAARKPLTYMTRADQYTLAAGVGA